MKLILKTIAAFFSCLPLGAALAIGCGLGWIYGSVIRYHRKDAIDALTRSFPDKTPSEIRGIVRRMYAGLGMNFVETCRLGKVTSDFLRANIEIEGEEHAREALARNQGAIILTGHVGNWDLLCTVVPRLGYPLTVISKDIKNKGLNEYWMNIRQRFGVKFVPAHNSYRACLTALKKNELIGFILDQNMIKTEGVFVDFFGKPACTTPGMAYMSAQSGAPVVPVFMIRRENGRHLVKVLPPLDPPPNREPETIREFTQRYTKIIEDVIRQYPDQWIWIHRRWKTVPAPPAAGQ
jgi:Kdo2-lipid IVA lauroyltransferase/acyltransferase